MAEPVFTEPDAAATDAATLKLLKYKNEQDEYRRMKLEKKARFQRQRPKGKDYPPFAPLQYFILLGNCLYPVAFGTSFENWTLSLACTAALSVAIQT
jgi:hypothetical protein